MPAHKVPLKVEQGATFDRTYTWKAGLAKTAAPATPVQGAAGAEK